MKCVVLAAGYATRMYPLTENFPKPLLEVGGKTILDWLIDDIDSSGVVEEYIVISNHKFIAHFTQWVKTKSQKITVLDDGSVSNETRLGAVMDIQFAIDKLGLDEELLVIAGDNLLDFSLTTFIKYALEKKACCIMRYYEEDLQKLRKSGVVYIDETERVYKMTEKAPDPTSHWCTPAFYYYTQEDARLIKKGIASGCGTDAPGNYIAWLCQHTPVYAMLMPGSRYDIGTLETYEKVKNTYCGI